VGNLPLHKSAYGILALDVYFMVVAVVTRKKKQAKQAKMEML